MDTHQDELTVLSVDDAAQIAIDRALQGPPQPALLWNQNTVTEALIHLSGRVETLCRREATEEELNAPSIFDEFMR